MIWSRSEYHLSPFLAHEKEAGAAQASCDVFERTVGGKVGIDLTVEFKVFDSFRVAINDVNDFLCMVGGLSLADGFEDTTHIRFKVGDHLGCGD